MMIHGGMLRREKAKDKLFGMLIVKDTNGMSGFVRLRRALLDGPHTPRGIVAVHGVHCEQTVRT